MYREYEQILVQNTHVEQMQRFLRRNPADELAGHKSFLYGKVPKINELNGSEVYYKEK